MRKKYKFRIITFILVSFSLLLSSWYVIHSDIYFFTDIARDFLLFQEIDVKKIILIGPRSSAGGLFHGPLWLYVNYPAYVLGHGSPVVVGWYWIILIAGFLCVSFYVAKKLFNESTALIYVLLLAVYFVSNSRGLFNPFGGLFVMPLLFYFYIKYLETFKVRYLLLHIIFLGCLIQFQMAVGIPFAILSFLYSFYFMVKKNKALHITAYALLILLLSNYIIFDLRHNFLLLKGILHYASPATINPEVSMLSVLQNRLGYFTDLSLVSYVPLVVTLAISIFFFIFLAQQIKDNKYKRIYFLAAYFYLGYILLTITSKNLLLYQQFIPIYPILYLDFSSFITSRYQKVFFFFFLLVYIINSSSAINFIKNADSFIGKNPESWKFLSGLTQKIYESKDKKFGLFVYSPDTFGYQPKYAVSYMSKIYPGRSSYLEKKQITYLIAAPPPPDNPYMKDKWWVENILHINKEPQSVTSFPNGYKIERYTLNEKEIKIPYEYNVDVGLFFR